MVARPTRHCRAVARDHAAAPKHGDCRATRERGRPRATFRELAIASIRPSRTRRSLTSNSNLVGDRLELMTRQVLQERALCSHERVSIFTLWTGIRTVRDLAVVELRARDRVPSAAERSYDPLRFLRASR